MLKKFIIIFAIFIILLLIISRCGSDVSTEQDVLTNVADNAESAAGGLAGLAKDSASNAIGASENTVNNVGSATGEISASAKTVMGDALDSVEKIDNNSGSIAEDVVNPAAKAVDDVGSAIENVTDSTEDAMGNPLNLATDTGKAQSREMVGSNLELNSVHFKFNSSELESRFYTTLDSAINKINSPIEVAGHTDNIGSDGFNMALSRRRAAAVLDYLVSKGVDANLLSAKGYGAESPVEDNSTSSGRDANRRVELYKK